MGRVGSLATALEEAQPQSEEERVVMGRPDLSEGQRRLQCPHRCQLQAPCPLLLKPQSGGAACRRRAPGRTLGFESHQPGRTPPPRPPCGENAVKLALSASTCYTNQPHIGPDASSCGPEQGLVPSRLHMTIRSLLFWRLWCGGLGVASTPAPVTDCPLPGCHVPGRGCPHHLLSVVPMNP